MRHKYLVLTVKTLLKSVYIYGSYRKIKTGLSLFWTTLYMYSLPPVSWRRRPSTGGYWNVSQCERYPRPTY